MLDGLLLVDKPSGPTSYDLIRWVKRTTRTTSSAPTKLKIGHCGTLDPLASGLMILLFGKSTKRQSEIMGQQKIYRCTMRLGLATDSGDITGNVIEKAAVPKIEPRDLEAIQQKFVGTQQQIPPMYSAIKKGGVPLYKLARKGEVAEREPRTITIYDLSFLRLGGEEIEFRVRCSSGTYVRTLVEDIAKALGSCGTVQTLTREGIGAFRVEQAVQGTSLKEMSEQQLAGCLQTISPC